MWGLNAGAQLAVGMSIWSTKFCCRCWREIARLSVSFYPPWMHILQTTVVNILLSWTISDADRKVAPNFFIQLNVLGKVKEYICDQIRGTSFWVTTSLIPALLLSFLSEFVPPSSLWAHDCSARIYLGHKLHRPVGRRGRGGQVLFVLFGGFKNDQRQC
jgi:hypothetical protein